VVVRDVSEQVFAQQTLAESERRVHRSEALARTGAFVIDGANSSVQWSDGMYAVYGVDPSGFEPSVESHLALIHPDDRAAVAEAIAAALVGGSPGGVDHRIAGAGQQWVSLALEPRPDSDGGVLGVGGVCQDITSRVASEATLALALEREQAVTEELRRVDALKDEFLATVSHELRTPLTSISGYAALLARRAPEQGELVEPIERNAHEMHRLIQRLLDQARLESGRVTIVPVDLRLADSAREVAANVAQSDGAQVVVEVGDEVWVNVDPDAIAHILANLIGNAAKYAPGGVITVRTVGTVPPGSDAMVTIAVVDDGPGIPPEYQEHLFDPFFRVPGAYRNAKGTGFGLAIVRRYVELHGGSVWCESEAGHGAAFCFTLPAGASAP
jgi:PAS domain S-box-containing protein